MVGSLDNKQQKEFIERFLYNYNAIDHALREALNVQSHVNFKELLYKYENKYPSWQFRYFLQHVADLRNLYTHLPERENDYLSVPLLSVIEKLEKINEGLTNPPRVYPKYKKDVEKFAPSDSLFSVLEVIHEKDYSQFPIYKENKFYGFLTENGITRWLANHVMINLSLVEFSEIPISAVLKKEEQRSNYTFIKRDTSVLDAENQFRQRTGMEALLITESGKENQSLLGIITTWDILNVNGG